MNQPAQRKLPLKADTIAQNPKNRLPRVKALGMTTVWVDNGSERGNHGMDSSFIDHRITDVAAWLDTILKGTP